PSDKLAYHLDLARTRLTEAEAMIARHRIDLADQALGSLNDQLNAAALVVQAEMQSDPTLAASLQDRLVQAIGTHDQQLAGLQGQVTNPAAVAAIVQARDRAAQALQTANQPASSNGGSKPSAAPTSNGNGKGPGPSATPHPTPKH
ncbi:MAG TPA: DUF5667 domain-containing protein, partial [Mycobacterium sp.]|nr:DUF5667 domain-containing protein [Mycobacterium sp.]